MRRPFTLYKEKTKTGTFWYVRFWDEAIQKYAHSRSTKIPVEGKKERRYEAEEAARLLYAELAPSQFKKAKPPTIQKPKTEPLIQKPIPLPTSNPALFTTVANTPLIQYLQQFWTPTSEYANFKRDVEKNPLTPYYVQMNHDDIRRHVEPYSGFNGLTVGTLNKAILKKYLIWLAGRKTQRRKKDGTIIEGDTMSSRRANAVLQAVRVAVRWAVDNEEIQIDPFHKLGEVTESIKEKGVLSLEERNALINLPMVDYRIRLVMLLGCLCGLRRGEIRGLQWGDIEKGIIHIRHNYQDQDGLKMPKYNSVRKVPVPAAVQAVLDIAKEKTLVAIAKDNEKLDMTNKKPLYISPESFVLVSPRYKGKPVSNNFFRRGVTEELSTLGISENQQKERILTCHSMRHTFVTLAQLSGIPDVIVSALAGHKSVTVTKKTYSHVPQVINFDEARTKIDNSYLNQKTA